jgi:hypothetical protein
LRNSQERETVQCLRTVGYQIENEFQNGGSTQSVGYLQRPSVRNSAGGGKAIDLRISLQTLCREKTKWPGAGRAGDAGMKNLTIPIVITVDKARDLKRAATTESGSTTGVTNELANQAPEMK